MNPIDIAGWILCTLLSISFIASLVFLPKEPSQEEEPEFKNPEKQSAARKTRDGSS